MKMITHKYLVLAVSFVLSGVLFAEGIYLPDLTTVVEDNSEVFIPEIDMKMSQDVELPLGTVETEVVLPEPEVVLEEPVVEEKNDFIMEGQVGVGYPGNFNVKYLLNGITNENPYVLNLVYDTMKNYSGLSQANGFYDRNLSVSGNKIFNWDVNQLNLEGMFNDTENGFQNIAESAFYNRSEYDAAVTYKRMLPKGFSFSTSLEGNLFFRSIEKVEDTKFSYLLPSVQGKWEHNGFEISLEGNYSLENSGDENTHRSSFSLDLQWKNRYAEIFGKVGTVFGNNIGNNKVLVPFTLGTTVTFPVKFADSDMSIGLEGGLSSEGKTVHFLEQNCPFSAFGYGEGGQKLPGEVSDWYGVLNVCFPVKSSFALDMNIEYRRTAFGNGFIQPVYSEDYLVNGLYAFSSFDRQLIASRENITFKTGPVNMHMGWISYFDFVPSTVNEQEVYISADYSYKNWDVFGEIDFPLVAQNGDSIPVLDLEGGYKLNKHARIAVNLKDTVKLIDSSNRMLAGQYAARSGSASVLLDFKY